jgi:hypothetical protein
VLADGVIEARWGLEPVLEPGQEVAVRTAAPMGRRYTFDKCRRAS